MVFDSEGAWSASISLPNEPRGPHYACLRVQGQEHYYRFAVEDFQADAFSVSLEHKDDYLTSEKVEVPVTARYFFGKPLSRARATWHFHCRDTSFAPPELDAFTFGRIHLAQAPTPQTLSEEAVLSPAGAFVISPELLLTNSPGVKAASLVVEVTDVNQQTITRRAEFLVHGSDFYLGLARPTAVFGADQPLRFEIVAVGNEGQLWPDRVSAHARIQRLDWRSVRVLGAGRTLRYHNELVLTNQLARELIIEPAQRLDQISRTVKGHELAGLPRLDPGNYLLELEARDSGGRPVLSSIEFQVSGQADLSWNYHNQVQMALKPDQKSFVPGQTARLTLEAPFAGTALVTVEGKRLRSFVTRLGGNAPCIEVPIETGDIPNVIISVNLIRGADECPRKIRETEQRIGSCELLVNAPESRLAVSVNPGATNYLPGELVQVDLKVNDHNGAPVPGAMVTLFAVDEGVLNLTDYSAPDLHDFFYAPRFYRVETGSSLHRMVPENPEQFHFENKGYLGGGGGKQPASIRKDFRACAFWNAALETDRAGSAQARFTAPDGLTRYRVIALAHNGATRFGGAQTNFQVSKPLAIEPSLPGFANVSDMIVARAVVHNQTDQAGEVEVRLELDQTAKPLEPGSRLSQKIFVKAMGSTAVEFPVRFVEMGEAKWRWSARFSPPDSPAYSDIVESRLKANLPVPLLHETLVKRLTSTEANLLASADAQLLAGRGTIGVRVANTRLHDLEETAVQLLHYPYGCVEQTSSRLLPWIVLRDRAKAFSSQTKLTNDPSITIRSGIERLFSMQTDSGGLGYWPGATEPMLWASAYGGMVLALAQRNGITVPKSQFERLLKYLSKELRTNVARSEQSSDHCLVLYTLALAGRAEPAYCEKLFQSRDTLSDEDRALLAMAILSHAGSNEMISKLLQSNRPSTNSYSQFGCAARTKAIRLLAWTGYQPNNSLVDRMVEELMKDQKQAHWATTQGNAWALFALTEYARRVEKEQASLEGLVVWCGQSQRFRLDSTCKVFQTGFKFTNAVNAPLKVINPSKNPLYCSVKIAAYPKEMRQSNQDRGFAVHRHYQRLDEFNQPQELKGLRVGDRLLVTLRVKVHRSSAYVVVDDALPSILEALNPELKSRETGFETITQHPSWPSSYRELRTDRCLSFANSVTAGEYLWRYVARVRTAGTVTAPSAKAEEMYQPEHFGLSETQTLTSAPLESYE